MDFVRRHKKKILVAGGAVSALVVVKKILSHYERQWQTSQARGFVHEARKKEIHFENTINECNNWCIDLSRQVIKNLDHNLDDQRLIDRLSQQPSLAVKDKVKTWNELKVRIITRLLGEVYSICIMVCYLRVQMSVIGGQMYCASVAQQNTTTIGAGGTNIDSASVKAYTKYAAVLGNMYRERLDKLIAPIQETVEETTRGYSLDYKISLEDFHTIFDKIKRSMSFALAGSDPKTRLFRLDLDQWDQQRQQQHEQQNSHKNHDSTPDSTIELNGNTAIGADLDPTSDDLVGTEEAAIRSMLIETQEIFESDDFQHVLDTSIDIGYSIVVDLIVGAFVRYEKKLNGKQKQQAEQIVGFTNPNSVQLPFVKMLPEIRTAMQERTESDRRALVNQLLCIDVLNCFAANVFEAFCSPAESS